MVRIGIQSGETVNADFFRGLWAFARLYDPPPPNGGALIYAGVAPQDRQGAAVRPVAGLAPLLNAVAG